jgi:hypothetical protein
LVLANVKKQNTKEKSPADVAHGYSCFWGKPAISLDTSAFSVISKSMQETEGLFKGPSINRRCLCE